jgi:hypothetical protein
MVASLAGPAAARRRLLLVRASFATDRVIRRRSIRMIYAAPPVSRRVLCNCDLTVVTVPADTDCTIRLENPGAGLEHGRLRADQELTGRDIFAYLQHSRVTGQCASAPGWSTR